MGHLITPVSRPGETAETTQREMPPAKDDSPRINAGWRNPELRVGQGAGQATSDSYSTSYNFITDPEVKRGPTLTPHDGMKVILYSKEVPQDEETWHFLGTHYYTLKQPAVLQITEPEGRKGDLSPILPKGTVVRVIINGSRGYETLVTFPETKDKPAKQVNFDGLRFYPPTPTPTPQGKPAPAPPAASMSSIGPRSPGAIRTTPA